MSGFAVAGGLPGEAAGPEVEAMTEAVPFHGAVARAFEDGWKTRRFFAREEGWQARLQARRAQAGLFGWRAPQDSDGGWAALNPLKEDPEIEALRRKDPERMKAVPTLEQLAAEYDRDLRAVRSDADAGARDHPVGAFLGGAAAAMVDPVNAMGAGATASWGVGRPLLTRMLSQAGAGALIEAGQAPVRMLDSSTFGPEYSLGEAGQDVLFGAAGGAAFEGGGAVVGALGRRVLRGSSEPLPRAVASGLDAADRDEAILRGLDGDDYDRAAAALDAGDRPPAIEPAQDLTTMFEGLGPTTGETGDVAIAGERSYRGRRIYSASFDPMGLQAAPRTFQYKADGDGEGVTARLKGVEAWDDSASGKVMVWEDRDGRRFVADGHQRRGLAQRMVGQGFEDIRLDGMLFREADGWMAREVRVLAALKNIREGSGTILDAAKVFRDQPAALADRSLPLTGEFMAQARGLAKLDREAFGAVVNKVIPERYGAAIGEIAGHRQDLHPDMVKLLKEGEPANLDDARAMVVEALQDDWIRSEGETIDLFGYDPAISAMASRAKVAAAVKRALAKDQRLFGQLVKNADAIEAGGNALARDANEAALAVDRAALELVSKLALRHGPVGEAMGEAALKVARGEATPAEASKGILQMVRNAVAAGERLNETRGATLDPKPVSEAAQGQLQGFDDYGGRAAADQAAFAPEDADLINTPGLFDDLAETGADERAHARLTRCAPGVG